MALLDMKKPSVFDRTCLQGARLDRVDCAVIPVAIQARDFALRVVPYDIYVGDAADLALLYKAGYIRGHSSTNQGLHNNGVVFSLDYLDNFGPEIGYGLWKAAPNLFKAAADGCDTVLAIGKVTPLCAVSTMSQHAIDIMVVVGGKELFGECLYIDGTVHGVSAGASNCRGTAYFMVRTIRKRALAAIILA